jgi:hypothetical protein
MIAALLNGSVFANRVRLPAVRIPASNINIKKTIFTNHMWLAGLLSSILEIPGPYFNPYLDFGFAAPSYL